MFDLSNECQVISINSLPSMGWANLLTLVDYSFKRKFVDDLMFQISLLTY